MRIEPLGESAYLLRDLPHAAYLIARALNESGERRIEEAVASYDTVGVYVREEVSASELERLVESLGRPSIEIRAHTVPVLYDGEDLSGSAERLGLTVDELVRLHGSVEYICFAIGFCPGFPYLGWLPEALRGVPRRDSPRPRVPAGSVAITGSQTAIYPLVRPGGWALIGRTPITIVDERDDYFPIAPGDTVRFAPISEAEYDALKGERL